MHLNILPNRAHTSVDMCHVDIYTLRSSPSQILLPAYLRVYHVKTRSMWHKYADDFSLAYRQTTPYSRYRIATM